MFVIFDGIVIAILIIIYGASFFSVIGVMTSDIRFGIVSFLALMSFQFSNARSNFRLNTGHLTSDSEVLGPIERNSEC